MKRIIPLLLLLFLTCAGAFAQQSPGEWLTFKSPEGRFSINMPGHPEGSSKEVNSEVGKLMLYTFEIGTDSGHFGAAYADYPIAPRDAANAAEVLVAVQNGSVKGINGKILSEKVISFKEYPGREFKASGEMNNFKFVYSARIFIVGQRLYQMVVVTSVGNEDRPDVSKFLTSFDIAEK